MTNRPTWIEYFSSMLDVAKSRATCLRAHYAAIIVKDNQVLATGYNGQPAGTEHCMKCLREELNIPSGQRYEICRSVHAEQNALAQAAKHGIRVDGATMFTSEIPCQLCAKFIINCGITVVIIQKAERLDAEGINILKSGNVSVAKITPIGVEPL